MDKTQAVEVVKKKRKEVALTGDSPADLIRLAISGKADLDKLEKLLILQRQHEADLAKKVFTEAFSTVQEKISAVVKTNLNPQTHSKYADLSDIIESAKPVYTSEGFSVIFYEGETDTDDNIRICADVLHRAGHKETYHLDIPLDGVGIKGNAMMTKIHAKASSVSYGRRYLMCMIWNIPTADDDGNAASVISRPPLTPAQPKEPMQGPQAEAQPTKKSNINSRLTAAINTLGAADTATCLKSCGLTSLKDIKTVAKAEMVLAFLEGTIKQRSETNDNK